ncbi:hypothetical protein M3M33_15000, partial [Loigolactobacillus coryniformis]|uniref:hypothetical protein n=1 Tax=Loigolactobacillus coryniformis TaxID=1610 RepID=UPI00201A2E1A
GTTADGAIPKSLVDAAGDLLIGTADNTVARLAIGTNGKVLQSNGTTASWQTPASSGGVKPYAMSLSGTRWYGLPGITIGTTAGLALV